MKQTIKEVKTKFDELLKIAKSHDIKVFVTIYLPLHIARGVLDTKDNKSLILISDWLSDYQKLNVLAHELGHFFHMNKFPNFRGYKWHDLNMDKEIYLDFCCGKLAIKDDSDKKYFLRKYKINESIADKIGKMILSDPNHF